MSGDTAAPSAIAAELAAIKSVVDTLEPLDDDARLRVLSYAAAVLEIAIVPPAKAKPITQLGNADDDVGDDEGVASDMPTAAPKYASFAELFDAASPTSNSDKALVAGYWLQVCEGNESFSGQSANNELKNLGQAIANITNAVDGLKNQKPALALQLRKSGKSQQARKSYKITVAGIKTVENMING